MIPKEGATASPLFLSRGGGAWKIPGAVKEKGEDEGIGTKRKKVLKGRPGCGFRSKEQQCNVRESLVWVTEISWEVQGEVY